MSNFYIKGPVNEERMTFQRCVRVQAHLLRHAHIYGLASRSPKASVKLSVIMMYASDIMIFLFLHGVDDCFL